MWASAFVLWAAPSSFSSLILLRLEPQILLSKQHRPLSVSLSLFCKYVSMPDRGLRRLIIWWGNGVFIFYHKVPEKLYLLPTFQAPQWFCGVKHSLLPLLLSCLFLSHKVLKGFKNRWMESKLGRGSLCVMEYQEASWLAPTVSCTLRKGHRLNISQSTSLHVHSRLFKYGIPASCSTPLHNDPPYFLQDATSSSPAQPEVIVVPLYLVNTDRGQEGTARPPASLGPLGCTHAGPATAPASSPLTFPTLDDFIPPHLQRRPQHSQPASALGPLPPVSQTPPSLSPPPPLVPPAPEDLHRASEPDLPGAASSTVSLLHCLPSPS